MAKFKVDYDSKEDLLYFYDTDKKAKGSVEFGELIIDLAKNGSIVGLELFDASEYLSQLTNKKITKHQLKNVKRCSMSAIQKKGTTIIKILLSIENKELLAPIAIQNIQYRSPIFARAH